MYSSYIIIYNLQCTTCIMYSITVQCTKSLWFILPDTTLSMTWIEPIEHSSNPLRDSPTGSIDWAPSLELLWYHCFLSLWYGPLGLWTSDWWIRCGCTYHYTIVIVRYNSEEWPLKEWQLWQSATLGTRRHRVSPSKESNYIMDQRFTSSIGRDTP